MAQPKEPYHIRPFPRQPSRGGKQLLEVLAALEKALGENIPSFDELSEIQKRLHEIANHFNDDALVDLLRQVSQGIDNLREDPSNALIEKVALNVLKVRAALKHL